MMCAPRMMGAPMMKKANMPMMKRGGAMPVKEEYKSSNIDQINDDFADKLIE